MLATPFTTEAVNLNGESGLIGMCFDPDFLNNHYVYFFLTAPTPDQKIVRYTDINNIGTNRTVILAGLANTAMIFTMAAGSALGTTGSFIGPSATTATAPA